MAADILLREPLDLLPEEQRIWLDYYDGPLSILSQAAGRLLLIYTDRALDFPVTVGQWVDLWIELSDAHAHAIRTRQDPLPTLREILQHAKLRHTRLCRGKVNAGQVDVVERVFYTAGELLVQEDRLPALDHRPIDLDYTSLWSPDGTLVWDSEE